MRDVNDKKAIASHLSAFQSKTLNASMTGGSVEGALQNKPHHLRKQSQLAPGVFVESVTLLTTMLSKDIAKTERKIPKASQFISSNNIPDCSSSWFLLQICNTSFNL